MERLLSTIFPCCFPASRRRAHSTDPSERTPLLPADTTSTSPPLPDSTSSSTAKRKPTSVLPSPVYDAHALKSILDDFSGKLIPVDSPSKLLSSTESIASQGRRVTPVHTLQRSITSSTAVVAGGKSKLVDIWSDGGEAIPAPPAGAAILSYSAAVKRGGAAAKKGGRRFVKGSPAAKDEVVSVEQRTYESLAELARTKPLVHDWGLDDPSET